MVRVAALLVAALAAGCVDQGAGPQPKKIDPAYVKARLHKVEPTDIERFDLTFSSGRLVYLGNKIDKQRVAPGEAVKLTHFWKVVFTVGSNWRPFTIVRAPAGSADFMNLDPTDMQLAYGPDKWIPGDIIEDTQTFTVRPDWRSPTATVLVGLIEIGRHGTLDRMLVEGPRTQDRAIVARVLEIDIARAPPPPGTVHIQRAAGEITIDGAATDPGWIGAASSPEFVTGEGSAEPVGKATAKMVWDDANLYLFVSITDTDIYSPFKQQDDPLWKGDAVEIFIDADGNRRGYVELQVSPNNITFDSWFPGPRAPTGDEAWDSGMVTAVKVNGTGDVAGDGDKGWDVEMAIPWAAVKGKDAAMQVRIPPRIGDRWRMNVVRVDRRSGNNTVSATSWNKITNDWHGLDRMLTVVFAHPNGQIAPIPPEPESGSGAGSGSAAIRPATGSGSAAIKPATETGSGSGTAKPGSGSAAIKPATSGSVVAPAAGSGVIKSTGSGATTTPSGSAGSGR